MYKVIFVFFLAIYIVGCVIGYENSKGKVNLVTGSEYNALKEYLRMNDGLKSKMVRELLQSMNYVNSGPKILKETTFLRIVEDLKGYDLLDVVDEIFPDVGKGSILIYDDYDTEYFIEHVRNAIAQQQDQDHKDFDYVREIIKQADMKQKFYSSWIAGCLYFDLAQKNSVSEGKGNICVLRLETHTILSLLREILKYLQLVDTSESYEMFQDLFSLTYPTDSSVIPTSLRKDKSHFLKNGDLLSLRFADPSLQKDKEVVLYAVNKHGYMLKYADASLRKDKKVVLAAVKRNGLSLKYADASLRKDKEVVLAAVKRNGLSLKYAEASLRKDKEVVLAAVKQNENAFKYAKLYPKIENTEE